MIPYYTVTYTAGYLLPDDDMSSQTISASAVDNSFNDSARGFPLLVAGDTIETSGFTNAGNNGVFTVVSRTASKVIVSATLTTEAAAASNKSFIVRTLPRDLERAAIDTVKAWYLSRKRDTTILTKKIGDLQITYQGNNFKPGPRLPEAIQELLKPWKRVA